MKCCSKIGATDTEGSLMMTHTLLRRFLQMMWSPVKYMWPSSRNMWVWQVRNSNRYIKNLFSLFYYVQQFKILNIHKLHVIKKGRISNIEWKLKFIQIKYKEFQSISLGQKLFFTRTEINKTYHQEIIREKYLRKDLFYLDMLIIFLF